MNQLLRYATTTWSPSKLVKRDPTVIGTYDSEVMILDLVIIGILQI